MRSSTPPPGHAHRLYLAQLRDYLHKSEQIQATWDAYSAGHSDPETAQPYDADAYAHRQNQRNKDTLGAFGRVYHHADELVSAAEQQLVQMPASDHALRHAWQLAQLGVSTQRLYEAHDAWLDDRHKLPKDAVEGTAAYEERLAEFHAEAWPHLHQWSLHGRALIEINELAHQQQPGQGQFHVPAMAKPVPAASAKPSAPRR
ncbi:hypothetical protein AB0B15_12025 [Streptomyces sp. NPDC045456]|uniref:hypothetical protein n=1 Tax=Streptomyces sp. NPDC045456 TaxID=3155254 RepID=UPI0033E14C91